MLRGDQPAGRRALGLGLTLAVGAASAWLVALGNPGNMGVCGACFLRDAAGALRMQDKVQIFRPEIAGLVLGALVLTLASRKPFGRSGSHAVARFVFGVWMAIAALVFLGCPFRMLQRLGGGDLTAWFAMPGLVAGVGAGLFFERRGYSVGKTAPAPGPVGALGPLAILALLGLFLVGGVLAGPGPDAAPDAKPAHAPWLAALGIATVAGALLSATGFCAISATRQVFPRAPGPQPNRIGAPGSDPNRESRKSPRWMLGAAGTLVLGYAVVALVAGKFNLASTGQPIAHGDVLWNALALALVGLAGALAGGCPVRQLVMTGEGNGDAFVTVAGLVVGGGLAHTLGLVSAPMAAATATVAAAPGGPTDAGCKAVAVGLAVCLSYGFAMAKREPA